MPEHLFVYGTLLEEVAPRQLRPVLARLIKVGPGQVSGRLHDLGPYPGLAAESQSRGGEPAAGRVVGMIYAIPPDPLLETQILRELDHFEGFDPVHEETSLFRRIRATVELRLPGGETETGGKLEAWVYVYNQHLGTAPVIASGDYLAYCRGEDSHSIDTGGISPWERAFTRAAIWRLVRSKSVRGITRRTLRSLKALDRLISGCRDEELLTRITVPRLLGIEESTRHWSLAEVTEHLIIVNRRVAAIVLALGSGSDPGPRWTILDVKPRGRPPQELRSELKWLPAELESAAAAVADWRSAARHPHVWFGPLSARGWWALDALHNSVHLRQAARIHRRLTVSPDRPRLGSS